MKYLLLYVMLRSSTGFAQERCQDEVQRFCAEAKPGPDTQKCLGEHVSKLSDPCKQNLMAGKGLGPFSNILGGMSLGASPVPVLAYNGAFTFAEKNSL